MGLPGKPAYPAYVYNCRSTNAWDMDLALTVTHFPCSRLTYAVLFGCPTYIEDEVIKRLSSAGEAAGYPLLLPGIFAELERNRHIKIVEDYMDDIEEKIFELDSRPSIMQQMHNSNTDRSRNKRSQWLDTTYLRNGLITWSEQLAKMTRHTNELRDTLFKPTRNHNFQIESDDYKYSNSTQKLHLNRREKHESNAEKDWRERTDEDYWDEDEGHKSEMRKIGVKVNDRLHSIIEEYEEKIRECTMRVDGMAMATQWSHGDTNVEIALATGRDSRHMRTISIVTMVFLPGTFFATIFSMQVFNWFPGGDDGTVVSHYIWIYVLITVVATLLTLGTWYYFVVWRHRARKEVEEDEIHLVA